MTANAWLQIVLFFGVLTGISIPIGISIAALFDQESRISRWCERIEAFLFLRIGISGATEMSWREYATAMLVFNGVGCISVYVIQRVQHLIPLNPSHLPAPSADSAFNTAVSFATNTNWQGYGGESTMSYFTQMVALTVQNFLSAATGLAVMIALIRGFERRQTRTIGNFWSDITRSSLCVLLPLSLVLALVLASQGVVQTFSPSIVATTIDQSEASASQVIAVGPVASQIAIKQLGTNGGGYFNANGAHPFENPTPLTNFLEMVAILLIPAALCHTFGTMIRDRRQGWALYTVMIIVLVGCAIPGVIAETDGSHAILSQTLGSTVPIDVSAGNLEGKETRFGAVNSALWAAATTAASNGSVNAMHDSFTPLGGLIPLVLMQFGEVIFGGVGSGLYGLLAFALITVFVSGLMVGRTPEYLGKKIGAYEMKLVTMIALVPCLLVLIGTALTVSVPSGSLAITNPGAHGFSQALYAYSSMGNNNGSAFAGFGANVPFHNILGGIVMWISRFWLAVPVLALAGALAQKVPSPPGPGTLPTHTPLFITLLIAVVLIVGVLTFLPALALGPIAEHLQLLGIK